MYTYIFGLELCESVCSICVICECMHEEDQRRRSMHCIHTYKCTPMSVHIVTSVSLYIVTPPFVCSLRDSDARFFEHLPQKRMCTHTRTRPRKCMNLSGFSPAYASFVSVCARVRACACARACVCACARACGWVCACRWLPACERQKMSCRASH